MHRIKISLLEDNFIHFISLAYPNEGTNVEATKTSRKKGQSVLKSRSGC